MRALTVPAWAFFCAFGIQGGEKASAGRALSESAGSPKDCMRLPGKEGQSIEEEQEIWA